MSVWVAMVLLWTAVPVSAVGDISSRSAVVYQPDSGLFLYEKDCRTPRPMASTTKLMTALLAAERLDPTVSVAVPAGAVPVEGSGMGLAAGDAVTVGDLLAGLLLASGNDAANALALLMADSLPAFAQLMNERAAQLGMTDSHFVTPSGLDGDGHAASARDMALLGAAVLKYPLLAQLCAAKTAPVTVAGRHMTLRNHNKLLELYDGCIGMKTGFTKKAGRCLVSAAVRDGVTLIVVTLNGGDYWNDHISLYNRSFPLVESRQLASPSAVACPVLGGVAASVPLQPRELPTVTLQRGETVTCRVESPAMLWAPVEADQPVGWAVYTAGERTVARLPLYTAQSVAARPVPTWYDLWWRRFCQLWWGLIT